MLRRYIERTLTNVGRKPMRHVATALALAVAFLVFGAFFIGWRTLAQSVERWGGAYEVTVYLSDEVDSAAGTETVGGMLAAQPEVSRVTHVDPRTARRRLAEALPESGVEGLPVAAFPRSFELRLREEARRPEAVEILAQRLRGAPGVASVETYGPWLDRLSSLASMGRVAALVFGLVVLAVAFVIVGFQARLSRSERREETELLRIVGATSSYVEVPVVLEGVLQGLVGAVAATLLLTLGLAVLRNVGGMTMWAPPLFAGVLFAFVGALVGGLAARRTAVRT